MRERYETLSLATLRDLAKARGLKGISTLKKAELIDVMVEADRKEKEAEQPKETKPNENSSINKSEFFKGVKFALDELAKGKTAEEILTAL